MDSDKKNQWIALRNRALILNSPYEIDGYWPDNAFGWGEKLFFTPLYIGSSAEGPRGELNSLYSLNAPPKENQCPNYQHCDTFKKDGKTYMILSTDKDIDKKSYLPKKWYVMEVKEGMRYGVLSSQYSS
ncbi:hypothetical protein D3C80_1650080 [compost metagenome]